MLLSMRARPLGHGISPPFAVMQTDARAQCYGRSWVRSIQGCGSRWRLSQRVAFTARWLARSRLGGERRLHARGRHRALAARHQVTGDFFSLRDFSRKSVPSEKASSGAADQYAVLQVAVLQLPPAVIHSPVRTTSQAQMAFLGLAGSTVQGLSRHHVQGVPDGHFKVFLPCCHCLSANWEYTVRIPLASVLGLTVSQATLARLGPSSTSHEQIATLGLLGSGMHGAEVHSANCCWHR